MKKKLGIYELYEKDPILADDLIWDRQSDPLSRRGFLKQHALQKMCLFIGASIPFSDWIPAGWLPAVMAESDSNFKIEGKDGLTVLNDRPINAECPPHLLDDEITPASRLFVRNNGLVPQLPDRSDAENWAFKIDGEVQHEKQWTLKQLKQDFQPVSLQLTLECGGNGRAGFYPPAKGNQWTYGAIGCPVWTGVPLYQLLEKCQLKPSAIYTAFYGTDEHISRDPNKVVISRGTPIQKALDPHTLLAWELNGQPLPALHGFPLRLVVPGYPGSASGKWLNRLWIRNQVHDGPKMTGSAYRIPKHPVAPGTQVPEEDMKIIEEMPVKSLITFPKSGGKITQAQSKSVHCRGFAWKGEKPIHAVDISFNFGKTWIRTKLHEQKNPYAWQRWETKFSLPQKGYYEIWARATDHLGHQQPMVVPGWNPKGYLNNAMPRISIEVV